MLSYLIILLFQPIIHFALAKFSRRVTLSFSKIDEYWTGKELKSSNTVSILLQKTLKYYPLVKAFEKKESIKEVRKQHIYALESSKSDCNKFFNNKFLDSNMTDLIKNNLHK